MPLDVEDTMGRGEDKAPSSLGNNRRSVPCPSQAAANTEREQGNEGGKNCDHDHDGTAVARKSLHFLDLSEF
jgi:hypothetical protein